MCSVRINRGFLFNTVFRVAEALSRSGNRLKACFICVRVRVRSVFAKIRPARRGEAKC